MYSYGRTLLALGFWSALSLLVACAGGEELSVSDTRGADADVGTDSASGDVIAASDTSAELSVCIINSSGPNSACASSGVLSFEAAVPQEALVRFVRVTNNTAGAVSFLAATIDDVTFSIRAVSFDAGVDAVEVPFPAVRQTGESIFFEVTLVASGGLLTADHMVVTTNAADQETLNVPIASLAGGDCPVGMADCDDDGQCESDLRTSLESCGTCGSLCNLVNAQGGCTAGECIFASCAFGYTDANLDPSDGCEYNCTFKSELDLPDPLFADANCDGIDGDAAKAIFVAEDGNDNSSGKPNTPLATLGAAIELALATEGVDQIYVSKGTYPEAIELVDGVSIFGSYSRDADWRRDGAYESIVSPTEVVAGRVVGVSGIDIVSETHFSGMVVEAGAVADSPGGTSYGLHCVRCTGLHVVGNRIVASNGADGTAGTAGTTGGVGSNGGNGGNGSADGGTRGSSGSEGGSACLRTGGLGGIGGSEGDHAGDNGGPGQLGTPGGNAGGGGNPGGDGADGSPGATALQGLPGAGGGPTGRLAANYWIGENGWSGEPGGDGNGGGGGGGGGGQGCLWCNDGTGNGGGGGGGGGCGGSPGTGGTAGGGSIGVVLVDCTGIEFSENVIRAGNGGAGGMGGPGGLGGTGGAGGTGATNASSEIGEGGDGGVGSPGGTGGPGGGGAGGASYGVFVVNTDIFVWANEIQAGAGGAGGGSPQGGNEGAIGFAGPTN